MTLIIHSGSQEPARNPSIQNSEQPEQPEQLDHAVAASNILASGASDATTEASAVFRKPKLLKPQETEYDQKLEQSVRPKSLADYIGQTRLKQSLQIALNAAKTRGEPMDHLLLYGPPGLGKTSLALVLAEELGTEIQITSAPALERPRDIVGVLMSLKPGQLLFIDEIHRLNKVTEEILYPAMEDFTLDRTIGKGNSTKLLRVPLPRFTLVGATTKAGSLSSPLRDRFGLIQRLNFYQPEELQAIVARSARIFNIQIHPEAALLIAQRARGTPRIANRLLRRVRDYVLVHQGLQPSDSSEISVEGARSALNLLNVDEWGLDLTDRLFLETLINTYHGGPVGLETLGSILGEDAKTLEDLVEPYLLQSGLLQRTSRGRMATPKTYQHFGLAIPVNSALAAQMHLSLDL